MAVSTAKIAIAMLESFKETYEQQPTLLKRVRFEEPRGSDMQNAGNFIWYPVEQHSPIISGWDLTNQETGIIEETFPAVLGTPNNDYVKVRADDHRDDRYWKRRAANSAKRQALELNKDIASAIATQGSLFYRSNDTSGYDFISEAQAIMNERQLPNTMRTFVLNDRDSRLFGQDLAGRQTLQGRPEQTWEMGQIAQNIADFDVFTGSYLPNITGAADPAVTVTGNQSFAPSGGSVNATTGVVTPVDYRSASLVVNNSALMTVGDKFTIENSGTPVYALGLGDKVSSGQAMTFSCITLTDATHIEIYPKPIAADDTNLTTLEAAYANIDTQILNAATITRLNVDATNKTNIFFDESAVMVLGGNIPADRFSEFAGMKVLSETMENGLVLYMVYDGDIETMTFRWRLFVWYGITVCNPSACGCAVTY